MVLGTILSIWHVLIYLSQQTDEADTIIPTL